MKEIIVTTPEQIESIVLHALIKHETKLKEGNGDKTLFTINKVAKLLSRSHTTIKKLVESGVIGSTADGLISQRHLDEYLKSNL